MFHTKIHFPRPSISLLVRPAGWPGGRLDFTENKANSVQIKLNLPVRTELGKMGGKKIELIYLKLLTPLPPKKDEPLKKRLKQKMF